MEGAKLLQAMTSGQVLEDPRILTRFVIHMFADLKKHHYYYWFAFPAFVLPEIQAKVNLLKNELEQSTIQNLSKAYLVWKKENPIQSGFFWFLVEELEIKILSLIDGMETDSHAILAFADPSTLPEHPGWPLRNLLAFMAVSYTHLTLPTIYSV